MNAVGIAARLLALSVLLTLAGSVAMAAEDEECDDNTLLTPCSTETARGEVIEADKAFLLVRGKGRLFFRRAKPDTEVQGVVLRVLGFGLGKTPSCADDADEMLIPDSLGKHADQWKQGFHIYILDWCNKSDDLRRNSLVFEKALELVRSGQIADDTALEADHKLIVIGTSMGGLVTRHALARMENEGTFHGVDLFISFDSPQEGAYLPIGVQLANQLFINVINGVSFLLAPPPLNLVPATTVAALAGNEQAQMLTGMNTQAAKQMLLVHHSTLGNGGPALSRRIFVDELNDLGYPEAIGLKRVAIASGSGLSRIPRRIEGFSWNSKTAGVKKDLPLRIKVAGKVVWSATLRARINFFVQLRIRPLTQGGENPEVFALVLDTRPVLRLNGLRLADARLPSASDLAEELGLTGTVADLAADEIDDLMDDVLDDLEKFVDSVLDQLRESGFKGRSDSEFAYEAGGGGLGDKYIAFAKALKDTGIKGDFSGGSEKEVFIPTTSALGLGGDPTGGISEDDIENSPFHQVYFHTTDTDHIEFTRQVDGWICQEVNDQIRKPYMTRIYPRNRPVKGTEFTITVEGSNFNQSSVVIWDDKNKTPMGRAELETTFVNPQKLEALVPAGRIGELTPCSELEDDDGNPIPNFCDNVRFPGIRDPVTIEVSTSGPANSPSIAPRRSPTRSTCAQSLNFDIKEVPLPELTPAAPTALDDISALYSDDWTTGCVPEQPKVSIQDNTITVMTTGDPGICTFLFAPYTLEFELGRLPAANYRMDIVDERGDTRTEIASFSFTVRNPQPMIGALNPDFIPANSPDSSLQVIGEGFIEGDSTVHWNGAPLETTFSSNSSVVATVPAANLTAEGMAEINVVTEDPVETRMSDPVELLIGVPELILSDLAPKSAPAGSPDAMVELRGDGFTQDTRVRWLGPNGAEFYLSASVASRGSLTVVLPATELQVVATHSLSVVRGPDESEALSFKVTGEPTREGIAIAEAVTNAASFAPTVAPGSIATLFGSALAGSTAEAKEFPIATELAGVSLLINGVPAPIFYASETQINFQAPFNLTPGLVPIVVVRDGRAGPTAGMNVVANSFGAFQYSRVPGQRDLIVIHQDGSLVTPDNPARPGEIVTLFATGIGDLTNKPPTGGPASASPLSVCAQPPQAFITARGGGELEAAVQFCGLAPGFAGLVQINIEIPFGPVGGPGAKLFLAFDEEDLLSWPLAVE